MIEPKKRAADMAVVPTAVKRPRTDLVAAAQSQQLVAMVRRVLTLYTKDWKSTHSNLLKATKIYTPPLTAAH